jgi:hypothetical protein
MSAVFSWLRVIPMQTLFPFLGRLQPQFAISTPIWHLYRFPVENHKCNDVCEENGDIKNLQKGMGTWKEKLTRLAF